MARLRLPHTRFTRGVALWALVTGLLFVGILTTLVDLSRLPGAEMRRANDDGQRVTIDPMTGAVSVGAANAAHKPEFDVGTADDAAKQAADGEPKSEAKPTDTPEAKAENSPPADGNKPATSAPTGNASTAAAPTAGLATLRTEPLSSGYPSVPRGHDSLVTAPAPEVTEAMDELLIPRRGKNGVTAAVLYAHRFTPAPGQHLLSFVVVDAGLDGQTMSMLMALPPEVSIAFSPYARNLKQIIVALRNSGHESWSMLPMMGAHYPEDDPGPLGLIATMPKEETMRRLHTVMSATQGSVGVVFPVDEAFSTHPESFADVLDEITSRGQYVLSTHPTHSIRQLTQNKAETPMLYRADILLDTTANKAVIESKLAGIMQTAASNDMTVVVATARPQTLEILQDWFSHNSFAPTTPPGPIALAPLSAVFAAANKTATPAPAEGDKKPDDGGAAPAADSAKPTDAKPDATAEGKN